MTSVIRQFANGKFRIDAFCGRGYLNAVCIQLMNHLVGSGCGGKGDGEVKGMGR